MEKFTDLRIVSFQELDDDDIALKKKQLEDAKKLKEAAAKASQKGPMGSESCFLPFGIAETSL